MATAEQITEVREMIGEVIVSGEDASSTLFSDERIGAWIDAVPGNLNGAALRGWRAKMAHFANLVSVTDGAASREFSDLFDHAVLMVKEYGKLAQGPAVGRTRIGKIVRS